MIAKLFELAVSAEDWHYRRVGKKGFFFFKDQLTFKSDTLLDRQPQYKVNYPNGHTEYCTT